MEVFALFPAFAPQLTDGAPDLPQLGVVGVVGKAVLIGETQHFVIDARRVADAQYFDPAVHQFLADPVNRGVALGTHEHLCLTHERLVDGLDKRRRLARARRAMHHTHILGAQHIVHCAFLTRVEPLEPHRLKGERTGGLTGVKQVAQVGQAGALGIDDALQGIKHDTVTRLVKEQLQAYGHCGILQLQGVPLGDGDDHSVAVNIGYAAGEIEETDALGLFKVACRRIGIKEHDWLAVLEIVVDFLVGLACHLDAELVH